MSHTHTHPLAARRERVGRTNATNTCMHLLPRSQSRPGREPPHPPVPAWLTHLRLTASRAATTAHRSIPPTAGCCAAREAASDLCGRATPEPRARTSAPTRARHPGPTGATAPRRSRHQRAGCWSPVEAGARLVEPPGRSRSRCPRLDPAGPSPRPDCEEPPSTARLTGRVLATTSSPAARVLPSFPAAGWPPPTGTPAPRPPMHELLLCGPSPLHEGLPP